MRKLIVSTLLITALLAAPAVVQWKPGKAEESLSRPTFSNIAAEAGIRFLHESSHTPQKYLIETMGAGVAWLDFDQDGFLDLFFVNGAALKDPMPAEDEPDKSDSRSWNRLYRNAGDGTFVDVTERSGLQGKGYGMGVATGDYDNDGKTDLFVTNFGSNLLFHNEGNGAFKDETAHAGVAGGGWSVGAAFWITIATAISICSWRATWIGISTITPGADRKLSRRGDTVIRTLLRL